MTCQQGKDAETLQVEVIILFNKLLRYKVPKAVQQASRPGFGEELQRGRKLAISVL